MSTGWRRVLMTTTSAGLVCLGLGTTAAALVSGAEAAASAAAAGGLVVILSFLSLALIDWAERNRPQLAIPLFMIGFALKLAVLALVLPMVRVGEWLDPAWALGTGVAVLLVWQIVEVMSFAKMRLAVGTASAAD
ncbi:hypothetical protein [Nesterenkonia ebinurensis]|uniref:hypothetical protein n=1 Tax=Nesterenkonia ebinurensis TaxID=2608252 RepID=UPI00123DDD9F|nr:hypothetical protein [Nesterenkonia ebinurensis]